MSSPIFTGQSLGTIIAPISYYGCKFSTISAIILTDLGIWVIGPPGQYSSISVGLYDSSGNLIGSTVSVSTSGPTGVYAYTALGSPINLTISTDYFLMAQLLFNEAYSGANTTVTPSSVVSVIDSATGVPGSFSLDGNGANHCHGPVNALYTTGSATASLKLNALLNGISASGPFFANPLGYPVH